MTVDVSSGYDSRPDTYEHIAVVRGLLLEVIRELLARSHEHDETKLKSPEKEYFDEFTPRLAEVSYASVEYKECLEKMQPALTHHYLANRHHVEHHARGVRGMNLIDLTEMVVDWIAASRRHSDGDIFKSIEQNQDRFRYGDELKEILINTAQNILDMEHG